MKNTHTKKKLAEEAAAASGAERVAREPPARPPDRNAHANTPETPWARQPPREPLGRVGHSRGHREQGRAPQRGHARSRGQAKVTTDNITPPGAS